MNNNPITLEKARKLYYGNTYGNKNLPSNYQEGRCASEVSDHGSRISHFYQCRRGNGHGPAGLYCHQHAENIFGIADTSEDQTWYLLSNSWSFADFKVEPVQVVRFTAHSVWLRHGEGIRQEKRADSYHLYVPSIEEAKEILTRRLEKYRKAMVENEAAYQESMRGLDGPRLA